MNPTDIHPKVTGATAGAAIATLITYGLGAFHIVLPTEVSAALPIVLSFVGGYLPSS